MFNIVRKNSVRWKTVQRYEVRKYCANLEKGIFCDVTIRNGYVAYSSSRKMAMFHFFKHQNVCYLARFCALCALTKGLIWVQIVSEHKKWVH